MSGDPLDPRVWNVGWLRALVGIQRGDTAPAVAYLKFVEQHRSRKIAETTRELLRSSARHPAWKNASQDLKKAELAYADHAPSTAPSPPFAPPPPDPVFGGDVVDAGSPGPAPTRVGNSGHRFVPYVGAQPVRADQQPPLF